MTTIETRYGDMPIEEARKQVNALAKAVRVFLKERMANTYAYPGRGADAAGNRVYVHRSFEDPYRGMIAEIVYESSADWSYDFMETLYEGGFNSDLALDMGPLEVDAGGSYTLEVRV